MPGERGGRAEQERGAGERGGRAGQEIGAGEGKKQGPRTTGTDVIGLLKQHPSSAAAMTLGEAQDQ